MLSLFHYIFFGILCCFFYIILRALKDLKFYYDNGCNGMYLFIFLFFLFENDRVKLFIDQRKEKYEFIS
jgi:hypothetical protein